MLLTLSLISCFKNEKKFTEKVLNQTSTSVSHFDPQLATGLASSIQIGKIYESLLETHPFYGPYEVLPNLASKLPRVSKDARTYYFDIRKNVRFHPCECFKGKTRFLKAQDFVNAFKRIADPKLNSPHYGFWKKQIVGLESWYNVNKELAATDYKLELEGVKATSPYTLEIKILRPDLYFINNLTNASLAPIPKEAIEFYKNDLSFNTVGTGPFVMTNYIRKNKIEFIRNKNYRDKFFPKNSHARFEKYINEYAGKQIPFLDKINVYIMNEANTQWLSFLGGKVDYLEVPKDNFSQALTPSKEMTGPMKEKGIKLGMTTSQNNVYYFGVNNQKPFLRNKFVRRAMSLAFDREKYNNLFFNGTADIATSILPPEVIGNNPPLAYPNHDSEIDMAKKELIKAGYPNGKGLPTFTLTVKNSTLARQIAEFFVKEMKQIGINIKLEIVSWAKLLDKANKGQYDIFYLAWFVGVPSGFEFFNLVYGPNWPGSYNRVGYQNKELDRLYDEALDSVDPLTHQKIFRKMNLIVKDELPLIPLVHAKDFFLKQAWLKNYVPSEIAGGLEQYYDVDLDVKKKYLSSQ